MQVKFLDVKTNRLIVEWTSSSPVLPHDGDFISLEAGPVGLHEVVGPATFHVGGADKVFVTFYVRHVTLRESLKPRDAANYQQ